jgi:hypothetical protein
MFTQNKIKTLLLISLFYVFAILACSTDSIKQSPEEKAVISVVENFFLALEKHDSTLAVTVVLPEAKFFSVREDSSGVRWNSSVGEDFIKRVASSEEDWLERMWEPKVLIHKQMAVVWTPYDFYRNREFSHCGIDAFNLIKTNKGWKIAGIVYTVEPDGCEASPLGPPVF